MTDIPPRVALDVSAVPRELTGAGVYVSELAAALCRRDDVEVELVSRRHDVERWRALGPSALRAVAPDSLPARLLFGEIGLGRAVRTGSVELLHGPHYTMPRRSPLPVVVTIHDLTLVEHPEWHERRKVRYFGRAIGRAAREASRLICVSEHTASRMRARYSPACPVDVIPHGVDHRRFSPDEPADGADAAALTALGVDGPYLLFLGTLEPRKNVASLVEAFDRLAGSDPELSLVLAGKPGWGNAPLEWAIEGARHRQRIRRLGYVEQEHVPALLRSAGAVAYLSKEEGFGLPALEALACGAPLVTSADSVMSELAGPAAWAVGPDPSELDAALLEALSSGADRRESGIARAGEFTWERSAAAHLTSYREAIG